MTDGIKKFSGGTRRVASRPGINSEDVHPEDADEENVKGMREEGRRGPKRGAQLY